ncbi:FAD binding domain-containing protein, partial [Streptacidiphilus monticola]
MRPFRYVRAQDPQQAVALVAADPDARYLGGGTNLVDLMRLGVEAPGTLVDVSGLPLDRIEQASDGGLLVGGEVRNSDLAADRRVRESWPAVAQALLSGASGQLRNAATVGGNLLQRTRCGYFQDPAKPCNKREPGTGCPALTGDHRNLAVLGRSEHCVATHPSDFAVALAACDATVHVRGADGTRVLPVAELHRLPGERPDLETVLQHGELITGVELPARELLRGSVYRKVRDRASFAFALVSVAAALSVTDGRVADVRIALGGVAAKPWRALRAEQALRGGPAST